MPPQKKEKKLIQKAEKIPGSLTRRAERAGMTLKEYRDKKIASLAKLRKK